MPLLKNIKHEKFAQAFVLTGNASAALIAAGYAANRKNVTQIKTNKDVESRIAEIRAENGAKCEKSKQDIQVWLGRIIDGKEFVLPEQIKAAEILNRMNGWNEPEKVEVKGEVSILAGAAIDIALGNLAKR